MRLAVLCSRYPAVSHTFIRREVRELRARGVRVDTFSVRRARPEDVLSESDREELATTFAILPAGGRLPLAHAAALLRSPRGWLGTLLRALRLSPGTPRGTLWQLWYFAEAVILWRELDRRGLRHVHAHFANVASDVALLATDLGNRLDRGGWSWSLAFHGPAQLYGVREHRLAAKVADAAFVACVSDHLRSQLMMITDPRHWSKLERVRTGVDLARFSRNGSHDARRILTVARLVHGKGLDVLLDALAALERRGTDFEAVIVGDGPDRPRLDRRAAQLGLAERVRFVGAVGHDSIHEHYERAAVFCLPSFAEGVPVVVMEAMAAGVPVVASHVTGLPELVEDGRSGVLVPPGRSDALADALERVLDAAPAERRAMGAAGRSRVEAEFDSSRGTERLLELLDGCYST